jgi:membrane-associated phospholipid phosphatase
MKVLSKPLLFLFLLTISYSVLDKRIALFVQELLKSGTALSLFSMDIPDLLFLMVCVITVVSWTAFFYLNREGGSAKLARFFLLLGISVPVVFALKSVLKFLIGRITVRYWLLYPDAPEFQWLSGVENYSGFPSGHMAVFTVMVLALRRYFPRYRGVYYAVLSSLGLALILTGYHFLSDIIAGVYIGIVIDHLVYRGIEKSA